MFTKPLLLCTYMFTPNQTLPLYLLTAMDNNPYNQLNTAPLATCMNICIWC